jgi:hypothetical protein
MGGAVAQHRHTAAGDEWARGLAMRPPPFHHKAAVAKFVAKEIRQRRNDQFYEEYLDNVARGIDPISPEFADLCLGNEQKEVARALRGDPTGLAYLLDPISPPNNPASNIVLSPDNRAKARPARETLKPETWELICEYLRGERKAVPPTPPKRKRGGQKKTADERRAMNPIHDAVEEFPTIHEILLATYSDKESRRDIRHRAEEITAKRHGVETSTLYSHLHVSKTDPRRLK